MKPLRLVIFDYWLVGFEGDANVDSVRDGDLNESVMLELECYIWRRECYSGRWSSDKPRAYDKDEFSCPPNTVTVQVRPRLL